MPRILSRLRPHEKVGRKLIEHARRAARPLRTAAELDPLLARIGNARYVLLGEASHGTSEFYTWRTEISQRLIREQGFRFIAVEGDWPDCYRVNRYIKGLFDSGDSAYDVLHAFDRWPTWMWANQEVVVLAEWLRRHNENLPADRKVGFYGLDVYSLWDSLHVVIDYLEHTKSPAVAAARRAYRCFEPFADVQDYARATAWTPTSCEDEVIAMLADIRCRTPVYDHDGDESRFNVEQNALVAKNAEKYYRTMMSGGPESWNVRDRHMAETLERLMSRHGSDAKGIVWEHNTHIGDARATDMQSEGMVNVGQLVREAHPAEEVVLVGFSSYQGTVIAADEWEAPLEQMRVPPAREGSWEDVLHRAGPEDKLLLFDDPETREAFSEIRGHRAIGVVYHPQYGDRGNFVPTSLSSRYGAMLYIDQSQALHPLHIAVAPDAEVPETYPSAV